VAAWLLSVGGIFPAINNPQMPGLTKPFRVALVAHFPVSRVPLDAVCCEGRAEADAAEEEASIAARSFPMNIDVVRIGIVPTCFG